MIRSLTTSPRQAIAHAVLGVAIAAYEHWLDDPASDLAALLDNAMRQLAGAFGTVLG
jgi:TetR/AcrR family transcriptional regulator, regulator of mycofactocin system